MAPSTTLRLGDAAPPFALHDALSGAPCTLDALLARRAGGLLVFHRGMW